MLLGSGLATTSDSSGAFLLSGITRQSGKVLLRADVDRNGSFEKQRLLSLEALKAGPGKAISLGDVLLSDNARLEGKVLRGDAPGARGHAGSLAFLPEGPFSALSADDGMFVFNELPEGAVTISLFRAGYRAHELGEVQLSSGQTLLLRDITLVPVDASQLQPVKLSGRVVALPDTDTSAGSVELFDGSSSARASLSATGEFSFTATQALYTLTVRLPGYRTAVLSNVIVQGVDRDLGSIVIVSGSGVVGGAAGGTAGGNTAGGNSAGGNSAGGNTAGGNTAGGSTAGGSTAGGNTAGGNTAGGNTAGGSAGGLATPQLPVAVVAGRTQVRIGTTARLDGTRSFDPADGGPLAYRWVERSDAGVMLSANDSVLAGAPTFLAPAAPRLLAFDLAVTSQRGTASLAASTIVEVLAPPTARVSPTTLVMRTGTSSTLSAAASTDPTGAPLTFSWSVVAGNVQLSSSTGASVTVTAPSLPEAAQVSVVVSNAAVSADPLLIPIVVSSSAAPVATVDVGAPQVVGLGAPVTITATASSTNASEGFSFNWSQTSGGGPLVLVGPASPTVGFTAPNVAGRLTLAVTATGDAGAVGMAVATVDVEDDVRPVLVSSDPIDAPGASGGWYSLTATFSEALDPASVNPMNVSLREGLTTPVPVDLRLEGGARMVRITPQVPLIPGAAYTLDLGAVTDASPRKNPFAGRALAFNARQPRFTRWSYETGTNQPLPVFPAVAVSSTQVWVAGRDWTGSGHAPYAFEPNLADGGMLQTRIQLPGANPVPVMSRRGLVVNDVPHLLSPNSLSRTVMRTSASSWAGITGGGEVTIATDGQRLVGVSENYGPHWLSFTSPTTAPLDEHVDDYRGSSPAWVGLNPASQEGAFAAAVSGTAQFLVIPTTTRSLRAYLRLGASGPWQNLSSIAPLPSQAREVRAAFNGTTPIVCYVHVPATGRQLSCSAWTGSPAWNHANDLAPGTVESLDVFTRGQLTWLTFAAGGQIQVKWLRVGTGALSVSVLNGPTGVTSWSTPGRTSSNPEAFATTKALYVVWEEYVGPWNHLVLYEVE